MGIDLVRLSDRSGDLRKVSTHSLFLVNPMEGNEYHEL